MGEKTSSSAPAAQVQQPAPAAATSNTQQTTDHGRQNTSGPQSPQAYQGAIVTGHVLGLNQDGSMAIFDDGNGRKFTMPMGVASATTPASATSTPAPTPVSAPASQVIFMQAPPAEVPKKAKYRGHLKEGTGASGLDIFFNLDDEDEVARLRLDKEQVKKLDEHLLKPKVSEADIDAAIAKGKTEGSRPYKIAIGIAAVIAAVIAAAFIGWAIHGCGHNVPLTPPAQTTMVQASTPTPTCDPVVVSPVVVPAPVVNVTVPETKVVTRTIVREAQAPAAPAPVASAPIYGLRVWTESAASAAPAASAASAAPAPAAPVAPAAPAPAAPASSAAQ